MTIELKETGRGFVIGEFRDRYHAKCSIQESSLAEEACIWLGAGEERMHLTQEMAAALIPLLAHFVENGDLRLPEKAAGMDRDRLRQKIESDPDDLEVEARPALAALAEREASR